MIPDGTVEVLTPAVALGSSLVAGVFFTFSTFVMKALARLRPAQGIATMQAINVAAVTPPFMLALFGSGVGAIALVVAALPDLGERAATLRFVGGLVYLLGPIGLTISYHVPRNDRLATLDPAEAGADSHWARYVTEWTATNHVRTAAALVAATLLTIAHGAV